MTAIRQHYRSQAEIHRIHERVRLYMRGHRQTMDLGKQLWRKRCG